MQKEKILIVGPCAMESQAQVEETIIQAKRLGLNQLRLNPWKPRTSPGFDGVKEQGLLWAREAAQEGMNIAMEVLLPQHLMQAMNEIIAKSSHSILTAWIGSRNQNHEIQRAIAEIAAHEERVQLMIKNQPWVSEDHWVGIGKHVLDAGLDPAQLLLCHRGFAIPNSLGLRNMIDVDLALQVQHKLGDVPMLLDPSHIGGTVELVKMIATSAEALFFDGQIIEVHPHPKVALTDSKQQLTWTDLEEILPLIKRTHL